MMHGERGEAKHDRERRNRAPAAEPQANAMAASVTREGPLSAREAAVSW